MNSIKQKNSLAAKLTAYSALATAFVATSTNADAQIIYTDVNPDSTVSGGQYNLDLNNDGTPEFFLNQAVGSYGTQAVVIANNNNIGQGWLGYTNYSWNYADALNAGVNISVNAVFNNPSANSFATMAFVDSSAFGPWPGATDKYLGLRFVFNGNVYYGWARLTVAANGSAFTIKDYAYNSTPNAPISTGQTSSIIAAPITTNVLALDISDNGNGTDLGVSFDKANDESKIAEYRIIVVPSADTASFDLTAANAVTAGNYTTISKTGSNLIATLPANAKDMNGNNIGNNINYNVYVLSVADGTIANQNALSVKSNIVRLEIKSAPVVNNVIATDIGNIGNGNDLQVSFNKAIDESQIMEYRIIVVPSTDTASFDLAAANAVQAANYTSVTKNGSDITTSLSATSMDKNGNAIAENAEYNVYILSVADGTLATSNSLSAKSNLIKLQNTVGIDELASAGVTAYAYGKEIYIYAPNAEFEDRIMIININGKLIYDEVINGNSKRIVLDRIASGIYIIKFSQGERYFSKKVFID